MAMLQVSQLQHIVKIIVQCNYMTNPLLLLREIYDLRLLLSFIAVGEDFTLSTTTVTFVGGTNTSTVNNITVNVLDDLLVEGIESFTLSVSVTPPASFVGDPVTVIILDDDSKCSYNCSPPAGYYNYSISF